jgi:hypothetical protein
MTPLIEQLIYYHPLIIEGHGSSDLRDPKPVAEQIVQQVESHFDSSIKTKPKLLITQGDPTSERGISAITKLVSEKLGIARGLVVLDENIDPNHSLNAPRDYVVWEAKYSELLAVLPEQTSQRIEEKIDEEIEVKNAKRKKSGKPPLVDWCKDYAMLQEVTKASVRTICGDITVAHTQNEIYEFSVTSFYSVGLELKLLDLESHYVPYSI